MMKVTLVLWCVNLPREQCWWLGQYCSGLVPGLWHLDVCTDCDLGVADNSPVPGMDRCGGWMSVLTVIWVLLIIVLAQAWTGVGVGCLY